VTDRPPPWKAVLEFIEKPSNRELKPADYATSVREACKVLAEYTDDDAAREFVLSQVLAQHQLERISKQHHQAVADLLSKPPSKRRGRPKGALGEETYDTKYRLYLEGTYEKTLDPSMTKERFAKKRLGITDEQYKNNDHAHTRVKALLQSLKPARMNYLDEGQRRSLDLLYPFVLSQSRMTLARNWREAKQRNPKLTREQFIRDDLNWAVGKISEDLIREQLEFLEQGEKLLSASEGR
jgi:hypothetical protein